MLEVVSPKGQRRQMLSCIPIGPKETCEPYEFIGQSVHEGCPTARVWPKGQAVHVVAPDSVDSAVPAGHARQNLTFQAPLLGLNFPGGHFWQLSELVPFGALLYVPAGHRMHIASVVLRYLPAGQLRQLLAVVEP